MIKYTLKCDNDHRFESWFHSADAFDKLLQARMISCSVCASQNVQKAVMAPSVSTSQRGDADPQGPLSAPATVAEQAMAEYRKYIEDNTENVGKDFAKEARAMHEGERDARAIRGEAKLDEAKSLIEDGVPVVPLPWSRKTNS